jgi:hypothetical protein
LEWAESAEEFGDTRSEQILENGQYVFLKARALRTGIVQFAWKVCRQAQLLEANIVEGEQAKSLLVKYRRP